jgi:hypothetical protein
VSQDQRPSQKDDKMPKKQCSTVMQQEKCADVTVYTIFLCNKSGQVQSQAGMA